MGTTANELNILGIENQIKTKEGCIKVYQRDIEWCRHQLVGLRRPKMDSNTKRTIEAYRKEIAQKQEK